MKSPRQVASLALALAAATAIGLAAPAHAQRADQASRHYEDALARFEKNDLGGAIVQLKNALQQDPKLLAAYVLLGKAELARGDAAAAEAALKRALELGVNRSEIAVPMAQALHDQGKYQDLLERFPAEGVPTARRLELLVLRGHAYKGIGDLASAARSFEEARALDPKFAPALLSHAELLARQGKRKEALKATDDAIALTPGDPRLWNLRATLMVAAGDVKAALGAYERAVSISPSYGDARIGRASLLIDLGRAAEAEPDIRELAKDHSDPRAVYIRAVYLGKRGDDAGTRDALNEVTRLIDPAPKQLLRDRAPEMLLLGGLAHYGLNQQEKAREYLEEYLKADGEHAGARKLLGSLLVTRGDYREAISVLEPALKSSASDAELLALLAAANMGRRQYQTATAYLERALAVSGEAPRIHATLGFSLVASGQPELGMDHLRQAFKKDPGQPRAGIALALLQLRRGQVQEAVKVAEAVVQRDPKNVVALNLLGIARSASGDRKGARAAYERAIATDRAFLAAELNLARLDLAEAKPDAARTRLQAVLRDQPKSIQAMIDLAAVEERAGRREDAVRWLEKAHALDRRNVQATVRLADLHILMKAPEKALEVAKDGEVVAPDDLPSLAALVRAYLALGNEKTAQTTLSRMTRLAAFDPAWLTEIAQYQLAANDPKGAAYSLDKALASKPDWLPAQVVATELELRAGDLAKAEQRAKTIASRNPSLAIGHRLLADVALARKSYPDAIRWYRVAFEKEETSAGAVRLFQAYAQSGNMNQATAFMTAWVKKHPGDLLALRALAQGHLLAGDLAAAKTWHEQVLKHGDDPVALNNLATILARQGDPKALEYAQKAYQRAPKEGAIQDTLGWVLVQRGQVEQGLRHLREARLREPQNPAIRYHLAVALAKTGRTDEAREELAAALKAEPTFGEAAEARRLQSALAGR
jgi:putative PEP-CTERM system TPR-repeat lipoprotein